jgi:CBS domain-containing protein
MQARDVMVSPVVTVGNGATVRDVARILLEKHISAVPVVDNGGKLVGIVSEGDLMHRTEAGTEHPYSWWGISSPVMRRSRPITSNRMRYGSKTL